MTTKDYESQICELKKKIQILEEETVRNKKSCKNNSYSIIILAIGLIFLSIAI